VSGAKPTGSEDKSTASPRGNGNEKYKKINTSKQKQSRTNVINVLRPLW